MLAARHESLEHLLAILQHHDSPHHILELTHIAAPGILQESGGRLRRELLPSAVLLVELREESGGQAEDLLFAFSQRRDANLHHVETVVEIFPEVTAGERVLEIPIRRRHDSNVDIDDPVPADPREAEILKDMQKLGLEGEGKFGDLVEVDRPLVGVLELPGLTAVGSSERALLVAEQLRLSRGIAAPLTLMNGPIQRREAAW